MIFRDCVLILHKQVRKKGQETKLHRQRKPPKQMMLPRQERTPKRRKPPKQRRLLKLKRLPRRRPPK